MKVLIVGGVAGGAGTAARLRRNDEKAEIILLEKGEFISFANCGLPYYISGVIDEENKLLLQTPKGFGTRFNVDVRILNEVIKVNSDKKEVEIKNHQTGETYTESYDKLVLSPGADPVMPPITGIEKNKVFTLRNIPDTLAIKNYADKKRPKSCTIIGAGFIGLEMAENIHALGIDVNIVEAANHVMATIDEDMSYDVQNHIRGKGVKLYLNKKLVEITEDSVILEDGTVVKSEMIIMSIGVKPSTDFLAGSGVELGMKNAIKTNNKMETSVKDIYALGDAVIVKHFVSGEDTNIPLASPANKQARIIANILAGADDSYNGTQGTAVAKVFDMTVATTGLNEKDLKRIGKDYRKSLTYSANHATYYPGASMMFFKLLYEPNGKILGAQITGFDGVDKRIDVIATAIRAGMSVYDLTELELAYAPPYSAPKDPVNTAGLVAENFLTGNSHLFYIEDIKEIPQDITFLDVRTGGECGKGMIPATVNIPLDELRENLDKLDKNKKIFITCQIGLRGYLAEKILKNNGFEVCNLSGGYRLYKAYLDDKESREKM